MENFVLYHEIYKRDGMTMYKGRKKGTITYVAISCIDKGERIKVTNHVRLVYELEHEHVVKFYEWYETSNHLWLVTELCVGGTLAQVLQQDVRLPESAVRIFGCHLVRGIHHMHCNELIYANWHPSKIILSGNGLLKFFDFSDSRKINEDPKDLVQRFFSTLNLEQSEIDELFASRPVCEYSAPEVLQGCVPGPASDMWGLGCIMYEMLSGSPPFVHEDPQQLTHQILSTPLIVPHAHSASTQLNDLLQNLFTKQHESRISLSEVCSHPFWEGMLDDIVGPCAAFVSPTPRTAHGPLSIADDTSTSTIDDVSFTLHLGSRPTDTRDVSKPPQFDLEPQVLGVRHASVPTDKQHLIVIATATSKDSSLKTHNDEYIKMTKDGRLKFDSKLLAVPPYSVLKWKTLRKADKDKHLKQLDSLFKNGEKGPASQRRLHLINYLAQLAMCTDVSNHVIESGLAADLCRQLRGNSNQELVARVCQALSVIVHHGTSPASATELTSLYGEMVAILADLLRDQFRCSRIKLPCVTALGECLQQLAQVPVSMPPGNEEVSETTAIGLAINLINRCLNRSEEVPVSLAAARAIDAVSQHADSPITKQLAAAETMQQLYCGYKHATIDTLKTSAVSALCRLSRVDGALFAALVDKVGAAALLDNLHLALLAVQERFMEMFLLAIIGQGASASVRKLTQDGGFLRSAMRLLETTSPIVRAKALLLVLLVCESDVALLRTATEHRLVLYLERELKRCPRLAAEDLQDRCSVVEQSVALLTAFLATSAVPGVLQDCCTALVAVQGRKHPSAAHLKALRRALPLLESVAAIVSSSSLRLAVLSDSVSFCRSLAAVLVHAQLVDSGQTNIGLDTAPHFLTHTIALVEAASHCPDTYSLLCHVLPPLAHLTQSASNADLRIVALKLCADIVHSVTDSDNDVSMRSLTEAVEASLLPQCQQFFSDPDPSAVYMLRLLRHYLGLATDSCIRACRRHSLPQLLLQLLIDHQTRVMAATVLESLLFVSTIALASGDLLRDLVLDADLVPLLSELVLEIGDHFHKDDKGQQSPKTTEFFLTGMETLYSLSRLISDVVRSALQSKRRCDSEEVTAKLTVEAEQLLGAGKPLTDTVDLLIFTVGSEGPDNEIGDTATRLLNQVVSLYGGQQIQHGLREANLRSLCQAITGAASVKQRRTLLRILKRLLAAGNQSSTVDGSVLVQQMVVKVTAMCAVEADAASQSLLDDIARCIDV